MVHLIFSIMQDAQQQRPVDNSVRPAKLAEKKKPQHEWNDKDWKRWYDAQAELQYDAEIEMGYERGSTNALWY